MSNDDIVFGEIKYREPVKAKRPDRDPRYACLAHGLPGAGDLPIFIDRKAADKIERHALRDTSVELGGIVLGKECVDEQNGAPFVWITEALEAKHYESSEARFKYTHESWEEITRERDRLHPDLDIVGWYHTHPDFGIFLSGLDLYIHENFFNQPLQVAYVVDPIRQTRGFFQWRNGRMESEPIGGFHVVSDRGDRVLLSRFVNDLEGIPNAEGGGGGLSPRLEAELIAMISRPAYAPQQSAYDQARASAFQSMIGMLLGALAVAAVFWINGLSARVETQNQRLDELRRSLDQTTDMQRLALDVLSRDPEKPGQLRTTPELTKLYADVVKERDRHRLDSESRLNAVDRLSQENKRYREEAERSGAKAVELEKTAKADADTIKRAQKVEKEFADLERKVADYTAAKSAVDLDNAVSLLKKYNSTWWTAVFGWGAAILAGIGVISLWVANNPVHEGYESRPTIPTPPGGPPPPPSTPSGETHIIS